VTDALCGHILLVVCEL